MTKQEAEKRAKHLNWLISVQSGFTHHYEVVETPNGTFQAVAVR